MRVDISYVHFFVLSILHFFVPSATLLHVMDNTPENRIDPNQAAQFMLELTHCQSVERLLETVVQAIVRSPDKPTIQIWLIEKGDRCATCQWAKQCTDHTRCFHMVAGKSYDPEIEKQTPIIRDTTNRIPLNIGYIGKTIQAELSESQPISLEEPVQQDEIGFEWARSIGMKEMGIATIVFKGEMLGAFTILTHSQLLRAGKPWGKIFSGYVGAALANARAFEEIHQLTAQLELQNNYLREVVIEAKAFGKLVGQSAALQRIISQIELVAPTEASVLILGETGTGKEMVAYEIHNRSLRKDGPMVRVNCASIPRELFESEFFGHVKGAFTGAYKDRAGRFETAAGGTLFLDEIGEIPMEMQGKLLRVLQEKCFERVGDDHTRFADVRIMAATNRDLKQAVDAGKFREDLYYRINVFPIEVPPLRERKDDIPLLVKHFVDLSVKELHCSKPRLTRAALSTLVDYDWPGNVRELRNVVERAVILSNGGTLHFDLPRPTSPTTPNSISTSVSNDTQDTEQDYLTEAEMLAKERENTLKVLEKTHWKIKGPDGAAELMGIKPTTLLSRIKKMGLQRKTNNK